MRPMYYILDDSGEPVPEPDVIAWARWFETGPRILAKDRDESAGPEDVEVSTVFLGLDHNFSLHGPPLLWETLVFGGPLDGQGDRYASRAAALAGHQAMCERVKTGH